MLISYIMDKQFVFLSSQVCANAVGSGTILRNYCSRISYKNRLDHKER